MCVCVVCVWRGWARGKPSPCVGSKRLCVKVQKRLRVCWQNARMCEHMRAFCRYARKRCEPIHGDGLNLHTWRRDGGRGREGFSSHFSSLRLTLSISVFLSLFLSLSSVVSLHLVLSFSLSLSQQR